MISLIAAIAANGVIGHKGMLPWRIPADLARFRALTWNKPVIFGRKTWQSIGKLPGRSVVVLTRDERYRHPDPSVVLAFSLPQALLVAEGLPGGKDEVFIGGGAEVYREALPLATRFYLTTVRGTYDGTTHFPAWERSEWVTLQTEFHNDHTFELMERG